MRTANLFYHLFPAALASTMTFDHVDENAFSSRPRTQDIERVHGLGKKALFAHEFAVGTKFFGEVMAELLTIKICSGLCARCA